MIGAFDARLPGRMQREPEENEPSHLIQRMLGRGGGSHAAAHRLAAGYEGQAWGGLLRGMHGGGYGRGKHRRAIGSATPLLHVWELVAKRCDPRGGKFPNQRFQKWMGHARTGSMGKHQQPARLCRPHQQRRNFTRTFDCETQLSCDTHVGRILAERLGGMMRLFNRNDIGPDQTMVIDHGPNPC